MRPGSQWDGNKGGKKDNNRFFIWRSQRPDCLCPPSLSCTELVPRPLLRPHQHQQRRAGGRMRPCLTKVNHDGTEQLQTSHSGASMKHFPQQTEGPLDSPGFNPSYQVTRRAAAGGGTCDGGLCAEKPPPTQTDPDPCGTSSEECHPGS